MGVSKKIAVGILGGTGYGAGELLRLFVGHPEIEIVSVVSSSQAGESIIDSHPNLAGFYGEPFVEELDFKTFEKFEHGVIISALPHNTSATTISSLYPEVEARNLKVIDLSGDFRLSNEEVRNEYYPDASAPPELREKFVYGLPELARDEIAEARYIANVGCLSASCILATLPLAGEPLAGPVVFDAKTGTSGAGRGLQTSMHHPSRANAFTAYKVLSHRHEPEILQGLGDSKGERIKTFFVPHLLPISRGIFVTSYLTLAEEKSEDEIVQMYEKFYRHAPFIRFRDEPSEIANVVGTNFCDISIAVRENQLVVMVALDNLVKGMAGNAIQNINLMCGLPEETGLLVPAIGPVAAS